MALKREFQVNLIETQMVAAAVPPPEHILPLSNLDLLLPPVDISVFFCYHKPKEISFETMVDVLKNSLSQCLVTYYAFSGELVNQASGEPQLVCNNCGVEFNEAFADIELKDLNLHTPDESLENLMPKRKCGVLGVQATRFECGGVMVACSFAHQVADAYSANMFLVSWANIAQSKPMSHAPIFNRSHLLPRQPATYNLSVGEMYTCIENSIPPTNQGRREMHRDQTGLSRFYYIKADKINEFQALANIDKGFDKRNMRTKLESFSAFLWKLIVSGRASSVDHHSKLGIVVDGRKVLFDGDGSLMSSYFGNVLSVPYGEMKMKDLKEKPLNQVADEVHEFVQNALSEEHFLGLIDLVELHRPRPVLAKVYANALTEKFTMVVSSGLHFPLNEMCFGWSAPVFGSYHLPRGGKAGYIMPIPSPKGNGDWIVYVNLIKELIELIESTSCVYPS